MNGLSSQKHARWRELRDHQGSILIETAVVLPIYFLLVFGFISFSLVGLDMCNLTFGTRAATRYIALHSVNSYGYTSDTATDAAAQLILNRFAIPYPTSTRTITYTYCGTQTNATGYAYNCIKVVSKAIYTISLPGYTYNGLTFTTGTEGILVAPH